MAETELRRMKIWLELQNISAVKSNEGQFIQESQSPYFDRQPIIHTMLTYLNVKFENKFKCILLDERVIK